jgi:hypothetical protein
MEIQTETKEIVEAKVQVGNLVEQAQTLARNIVDKPSYDQAGELLMYAKGMRKKITQYFKGIKDPINAARNEILRKEEEALAPLEAIEKSILGPRMSAFTMEQDRLRRIEEQKAQAEAYRLQQEAQLAAAVEAEKGGDKQMAEAIISEPIVVAPVSVPVFEQPKGLSSRETYKGECIDIRALVQGIIDGKVPITAVEANSTVINQAARAMKSELKWPGVRVWVDRTMVGRTA